MVVTNEWQHATNGKYSVAPEHSKQTKLGGGGQAIDHKQMPAPPPPPQKKKKKKKKKKQVCLLRVFRRHCKY